MKTGWLIIVDDESELVELLHEDFTDLGIRQIIVFTDPVAALQFIQTDCTLNDVLVTDLMMPQLPGGVLLQAAISKGMKTAVISGSVNVSTMKDPDSLIISKPWDRKDLKKIADLFVTKRRVA